MISLIWERRRKGKRPNEQNLRIMTKKRRMPSKVSKTTTLWRKTRHRNRVRPRREHKVPPARESERIPPIMRKRKRKTTTNLPTMLPILQNPNLDLRNPGLVGVKAAKLQQNVLKKVKRMTVTFRWSTHQRAIVVLKNGQRRNRLTTR